MVTRKRHRKLPTSRRTRFLGDARGTSIENLSTIPRILEYERQRGKFPPREPMTTTRITDDRISVDRSQISNNFYKSFSIAISCTAIKLLLEIAKSVPFVAYLGSSWITHIVLEVHYSDAKLSSLESTIKNVCQYFKNNPNAFLETATDILTPVVEFRNKIFESLLILLFSILSRH